MHLINIVVVVLSNVDVRDPRCPIYAVVAVVLSNMDVGDPRCPINGEDAILTHKL